jgi:hypothetical protein
MTDGSLSLLDQPFEDGRLFVLEEPTSPSEKRTRSRPMIRSVPFPLPILQSPLMADIYSISVLNRSEKRFLDWSICFSERRVRRRSSRLLTVSMLRLALGTRATMRSSRSDLRQHRDVSLHKVHVCLVSISCFFENGRRQDLRPSPKRTFASLRRPAATLPPSPFLFPFLSLIDMRQKRAKAYKRLMSAYSITFGFRQPFQTLRSFRPPLTLTL